MSLAKIPPQSLEAERATLGCILLDSDTLLQSLEHVDEDDFTSPVHRLIIKTINGLQQKNRPIDILTVTEQLRSENLLDKAGGASYISGLVDEIPTVKNFGTYLEIVKERALRRKLISLANEIIAESYDVNNEIKPIIDKIEKEILAVTQREYREQFLILKDLIINILDEIESRIKNENYYTGIPTGFKNLDALTSGFKRGNLVIIAARPSVGKTTFSLNLATNMVLDHDKTVGFFSLEMDAKSLGYKITSRITDVRYEDVEKGKIHINQLRNLINAISIVYDKKIIFDDSSSLTLFDIKQKARRMKVKYGLDALFIDYLQIISPPPNIRVENRAQTVAEISRGLKALAKELNIPIIALSQLSRDLEKREEKRPILADLRESGAIEQDADLVGMLYREDHSRKGEERDEQSRWTTEFILRKNRNGPQGTVKFKFEPEYCRFLELDEK